MKTYKHLLVAFLFALTIPFVSVAQETVKKDLKEKEEVNNWYQLDKTESGYYGISLNKAYDLLKGKKSKQVVVAVIDSGIDTAHEDLKGILWHNPKEIPGNGIDDDHNGYVDDVYGWNFIGGKDGRNVKEDSYEAARVYNSLKSRFATVKDPTTLNKDDQALYSLWKKSEKTIKQGVDSSEIFFLKMFYPTFKRGDSIISHDLKKDEYNGNDLKSYTTTDRDAAAIKNFMLRISEANQSYEISNKQLSGEMEGQLRKADAIENPPPAYRADIVKDDETNINDKFYGNKDVMAGTPFHGTHCSGIIAALRNNGKGMDGIADNVKIMMIRAVPDGDEHDKDISLAIRYAVDNGAQIISMSFGKDFSPGKKWVDDALKYAESKGVLLIHAAGNDNKNIDSTDNFPNPVYADGTGRCNNFITVGASGDPTNGGVTANFSNYGKKEVDVFAPGVKIYSTIPGGNTYGNASGTSMACPVVAGIAALILEYYPNLSAQQIKYVIEKSATPMTEKVNRPGTEEKVDLSDLSRSGGIANAYEAVKLAATLKGERKDMPVIKPKLKRKDRG
jgi:cell wall-associated protease